MAPAGEARIMTELPGETGWEASWLLGTLPAFLKSRLAPPPEGWDDEKRKPWWKSC
jgi:hypothetical protein